MSDDIAGTLIQGNYIGTKADGTSALGNQTAGIYTAYGVTGPTIGGTASGAGNVIAFNGTGNAGKGGVSISYGLPFTPGKSITVSRNAVFSNNGLGIDLGSNGVTTNDVGDGDSGPNDLQNFPVLTSVTTNGGGPAIQFSQATYSVQEDLGAVTLTIVRSGDASAAASVDYATSDAQAVEKSDYEIAAGTLELRSG
jgi:hypothetical protein